MKFTKNRIALAILFGVPASSVLLTPQIVYAQNIITVSSQAEFENAVQNSLGKKGTVISLLNNIVVSKYTETANGILPFTLGNNITIEGNNNSLTVRGAPLSLSGNVTLKNLKLELPPITNQISLDPNYVIDNEFDQFIYLNGNKLELDNVDTSIARWNERTRPTIVLGNGLNTNGDNNNAELILKNTTVKNIIAGNLNNKEKTTNSKIIIDKSSSVLDAVALGIENNPVSGKVEVITESQNVNRFNGAHSTNNSLEIKGVTGFKDTSIVEIQNLTLSNKSNISVNNLSINGTLTLKEGSKINANNASDDFFGINPINLGSIKSEGDNEIRLKDDNKLTITGEVSGNLNVVISGTNIQKDKAYVTAKNNKNTINVTAPNSLLNFKNENGEYKATTDLANSEIKQNGDSVTADSKPNAPVPNIKQNGDSVTADTKPNAPVPNIKQNGDSVTADTKPNAPVPNIKQNGDSVTADTKPNALVPNIKQNGDSVTADTKPNALVPNIKQNGDSVTADTKPNAPVPNIKQNGDSVTADTKPNAPVPNIKQNGDSVTTDTKPNAPVPNIKQNGDSVTEDTNNAPIPNIKQNGDSVTADTKPNVQVTELDTDALIAALHQAEMLLQQQQKAQRISNLVESNAAAQLNSITDVNMDIAQQVIEKFPTDGNQFRVWSNNTVTNSSAYRNAQQHYETDSFRSQLGVSGLINANTQLGAILTDVRNSNDFAYNSGKHHLQIASAFVKYQANNGTFAAFDLGAGRIKNKLKSANQTDSFSRKLVQTGLTLGQELTWNQLEATVKTGIRYNHLGHANYQLDELNVQEQAVDFVSYFAGLELGYKFALGTQFSVKPLISAEYWVHNGNAEIKVADREFSLETGNRQHFAAGVEMGYQNLKLSLSAGVTDGSKVAKQNVAKLNLNYQF
ncbi:autotransporter domain-containing protein [Actinobacillus equuli subsp. equuli]|uniref:autotransporter outer membrane beta-barrel domain-containing protein n=1 Tax=Actinobacillus equuli TaxID=718 RepID=UPI0024432EC9|nr:autotransporter domain-containing protein [Actinobacillus equuli]WGE65337.1 autotransporter domain-containing protein [Actinobacillus equuli subsp. equuli]